MAIRVIDTVTGAGFTFPMLPESLEYSRFGRFEQLKLLDGDASLPTGETAGRISFSGKLPGSKRSGAYIESRRAPGEDGPPDTAGAAARRSGAQSDAWVEKSYSRFSSTNCAWEIF